MSTRSLSSGKLVIQVWRRDSALNHISPFALLIFTAGEHAALDTTLSKVREMIVEQLSSELDSKQFSILMNNSAVNLEHEPVLRLQELFRAQGDERFIVISQPHVHEAPPSAQGQPPSPFHLGVGQSSASFQFEAVAPGVTRRSSSVGGGGEGMDDGGQVVLPNFGRMQSVKAEDFLTSHQPFREASVFPSISRSENALASPSISHRSNSSSSGLAGSSLTHDLSAYLEGEIDDVEDRDFLSVLDEALARGIGDPLKMVVMEPTGRFVRCENVGELIQILDFCKHQDLTLAKAKAMGSHAHGDKHVMWIDLEGCHVEQIVKIGERLDIHPLTIEDLAFSSPRQKLEPFENYIFLVLRSLHHEFHTTEDKENPIKILVFANLVLSLHFYPSFAITTARNRLKKHLQTKFLKRIESMVILHSLVDSIADTDVPVINKAEEEIRSLDTLGFELSKGEQSDLLLRMGNARQDNIKFRQWLWPKRDILLNLVQREYVSSFRRELTVAYFRDVYDHVVMMIQKLQISNEVLTSLESTYLAKVSIEMSQSANEVNEVMKKLTLFASIVVPMTFITGVFGMNISIPWETPGDDTGTLDAFFGIIGFMGAFTVVGLLYFKKMKYI
eukprot:TRINITY_DN4246_c0_g2_i2.p1 TRINITY_DN4246_c0_g2~~TRINITY_DN4246_c0_g2_i2.p1  ORF type:complete len:616 (+),score=145.60 TRINITY_DN4246_c0_g2_i2:20-1867(+)